MLQVFHIDVAKVDRDVAYDAMVVHMCCNLFVSNVSFFQIYVVSVFIWMLYMFHTYVCKCFIQKLRMFLQWFQLFLDVFACS
jgi:hypothetical protein